MTRHLRITMTLALAVATVLVVYSQPSVTVPLAFAALPLMRSIWVKYRD